MRSVLFSVELVKLKVMNESIDSTPEKRISGERSSTAGSRRGSVTSEEQ